jgi:hypothetical protein
VTAKHTYSREVRLIGYCIIVFEVLTVFTWGAAFYGNTSTLLNTATNALNSNSGHSIGLTNTTAGETLSVPIIGAGFFPVTISATAVFMNNQNQTVAQVQDSVTVSPGETKNLTILIPSAIGTSRTAINAYNIKINLDVLSLYGLSGIRGQVVVEPSKMGGNST